MVQSAIYAFYGYGIFGVDYKNVLIVCFTILWHMSRVDNSLFSLVSVRHRPNHKPTVKPSRTRGSVGSSKVGDISGVDSQLFIDYVNYKEKFL